MIKKSLYKPIEVEYRRIRKCPLSKAKYTFFQIIYIISGEGFATINSIRTSFRSGSLLLFVPDASHSLDFLEQSEALLIRFNKNFLKENNRDEINNLEALLYYSTSLKGCLLKDKTDKLMIKSIIDLMLLEISRETDHRFNDQLITHLVNALITITARNMVRDELISVKLNADQRIQKIIYYLQENIHCPEKLKAANISTQFGVSRNYLSNYFKNQTGETIQYFISQYRLRLIEHKLRFTDKRINEIVLELGFADESHLNKFFKKHKGLSVTGYKKALYSQSIAV